MVERHRKIEHRMPKMDTYRNPIGKKRIRRPRNRGLRKVYEELRIIHSVCTAADRTTTIFVTLG